MGRPGALDRSSHVALSLRNSHNQRGVIFLKVIRKCRGVTERFAAFFSS